jgi:hypothetical protein
MQKAQNSEEREMGPGFRREGERLIVWCSRLPSGDWTMREPGRAFARGILRLDAMFCLDETGGHGVPGPERTMEESPR